MSYDRKRCVRTLCWLAARGAFVVPLAALAGVYQGPSQDTQTLARRVIVSSDPPGATVWSKEGRTLTCLDTLTPGVVELQFRGADDVQRIRLRRFGYPGSNLDVRLSDDKVSAALGDPAPSSFLVTDDAKPELKQLNADLEKEFKETIFTDPEAFRCVPFELSFVHVMDDEGDLTLGVAVALDRSFGGPAFRIASHTAAPEERRQKTAQILLENGVADLLARIHRIAAKFADLKIVTILCAYRSTQAFVDFEEKSSMRTVPRLKVENRNTYNYYTGQWEMRTQLVTEYKSYVSQR